MRTRSLTTWLLLGGVALVSCNEVFGLDQSLPFPETESPTSSVTTMGAGGTTSTSGSGGSTTSSDGGSTTTGSRADGGGGMGGSAGDGGSTGVGGNGGSTGGGGMGGMGGIGGGPNIGGMGGMPLLSCKDEPPNAFGQKCPLYHPCSLFSDCGGANNYGLTWACIGSECELSSQSNNWVEIFDNACNADVVVRQRTLPPVDKKFLTPDGVNLRQVATLAITVYNYTADDLYLDYIPFQFETKGGFKLDVGSIKLYEDAGGSEYQSGDQYVGLSNGIPSNNKAGPYGGSSFSRVPKNGGFEKFVIVLAWAPSKQFIGGKSYRLNIVSSQGWEFRVGSTFGSAFGGTVCGVVPAGFQGAWLTAVNP